MVIMASRMLGLSVSQDSMISRTSGVNSVAPASWHAMSLPVTPRDFESSGFDGCNSGEAGCEFGEYVFSQPCSLELRCGNSS